jgi:O-6-methylguanine DNA methyltransferase
MARRNIHFIETDSAMGRMQIGATEKGICLITFFEENPKEKIREKYFLKSDVITFNDVKSGSSETHIKPDWTTRIQQAIADPKKAHSSDIPLDFLHATPFQKNVGEAMLSIACGQVKTYGKIAKQIGSHPRPVGGACGANRISILVPCHRVLGSDKGMHDYAWGIEKKQALLHREGYRGSL